MSLCIKDLEIWSLSLACALNNDSLSTDMLYRAIYRYTAFVIAPHSSVFSCLMLKMLWNPCWRHTFKKREKWPFIYRRSKLALFAQHLDLETWMSPSFSLETRLHGKVRAWGSLRPTPGHRAPQGAHTDASGFCHSPAQKQGDKVTNDQFRCATHCQRHTPCSHKAISWQGLVV